MKKMQAIWALAFAPFMSVPADAATIIQDFNLNGETTNFALQQFNPSQGMLQSVQYLLSPNAQRDFANPNPMPGLANFLLSASITFNSATPGAPSIMGWTKTENSLQNRLNNPYAFDVSDSLQTTTLNSGLSSFIGLSSFNYTATSDINILSGNAPVGAKLDNFSNGNLRVQYNYEAAGAVPEPSTWAMMIVGFGLVGGSMRRGRRQLAIA